MRFVGVEDVRQAGRPGPHGEPVDLAVGLHDLGVLALEELADLVGVDPHVGAGAVEAQEVGQHRVHDAEVDLHGPLVVAAALGEQVRQVGRAGEVDAAEVLPGALELVAAALPDAAVVLEEVGEVRRDAVGPRADLVGVGLGQRRAVEVGAGEARRDAAPGGQRQGLGRVLGAPAVAVAAPQGGGERGEASRPVEVEEPEALLVARLERARRVHDPGHVEVFRLVPRVPLARGEVVHRHHVGHLFLLDDERHVTVHPSGTVRQATRSTPGNVARRRTGAWVLSPGEA